GAMARDPLPFFPPLYLGGPEITTENCEREPIHIPGSIQPHGALLTADGHSGEVLQMSLNAATFLGQEPTVLRGQTLAALLPEQWPALQAALPPGCPDALQYRATLDWPAAGHLSLTVHRVGELLILEFEPTEAWDSTGPHALRNAMFALESAPNLRALAEVATQTVRELTGFDRVMLYKFAPDATGEVIAEARREGLHAFLGHRFPASDIPAQARALYTRHLLRLTADTRAAAVPLDPVLNPQTNAPTPLGGAVLRATSPMHMQYLRNMGVGSSLSVSVVVGGQLWGLIACHHQTPYVLPPDLRTTLEYLGRLLSLQVQVKEAADVAAFRQSLREHHARVALAAAHSLSPHDTLSDPALDLLGLMRAGGLILRFEGRWQTLGEVPPAPAVDALLAWLETQPGALVQTDALGQLWPAGADLAPSAAGLLAISVGEGWSECLVWLRPELRLEVAWGGATPDQAKDDLGPRHSFDTYLEEKRGYAEPWHPGEIEEAQDLRDTLTGALGERLSVIRVRNTFGRYLTDQVVATLLENPEGLKMGGDRRPITILTSDLRGFTSTSEGLNPEEVVKVLNIYFGKMADVITHHGGTIDKFMGDGILVLFGAPTSQQDDALRAVACGVEMQLALREVNQQVTGLGLQPLEMGIGINTGEVVVGNIGSEKRTKYGVVGAQVNLTYRIESYTTGGQIFISSTTLEAAGDRVHVNGNRTVQPKGVKDPVVIWDVAGVGEPYNLSLAVEEQKYV
uniref:Bacteriophytochrome,Adenylate cyclase n=1 Tax=Synechocystis sp. (strain ATCC 27184 / PCC 6803 / Kazusa) TaxID=1111708 RepID=UPI000D1D1474|nr:Chain A, Bacteriophytochrome,Adenylate cyclase [synthetic construct]6FHT_B Chain B, Bacteriophytochrome,Adenylate cyclase [synthetic construct]